MARRIFNREFSDECAPGGSTFCDGFDADDETCECPCHGSDPAFNVETVAGQMLAHQTMWRGVTL